MDDRDCIPEVDPLMDAIASQAGDYAVTEFGRRLPQAKKLRLWQRHYDGALSALLVFVDLSAARRVRRNAFISDN